MKIKVGVIFGGESVEHEVSVISAIQAMNKLDQEKYDIIPIYITKDREWFTGEMLRDVETYQDMTLINKYAKNVVLYYRKGRFVLQTKGFFKRVVNEIDLALPIVHGTNVEDGILQGYLQSIGIPYAGPNVYAAVVGQDKVYMKQIFESDNLPIPKYAWFYDNEVKEDITGVLKKINSLKYPVIVKPATLGSSVGIGTAANDEELKEAILDAIKYDTKIVVEEMVNNLKELNISVLGDYAHAKTSVIEEVIMANKFLSYEDKYVGKSGKVKGKAPIKGSKGMASASRKIPALIDDKLKHEIEEIALRAFKLLGSSGVTRIDFLIDAKANKPYINEINSIPGSMAFYLWEATGKDYTTLLDEVINIAIKDYKKRTSKTHSFESNILQGFSATNGIKGLKGLKNKL